MGTTLHGLEVFILQVMIVLGVIALVVWVSVMYKRAAEREAEARKLYDAAKEADLKRMAAEFAFLGKIYGKQRPVMTVDFETGEVMRGGDTSPTAQDDRKGVTSCRN